MQSLNRSQANRHYHLGQVDHYSVQVKRQPDLSDSEGRHTGDGFGEIIFMSLNEVSKHMKLLETAVSAVTLELIKREGGHVN